MHGYIQEYNLNYGALSGRGCFFLVFDKLQCEKIAYMRIYTNEFLVVIIKLEDHVLKEVQGC